MNNKGFSLVELLAVVSIMAIITVIAIPSIQKIQSNILEKDYKAIVTNIETAAKDWAYDNLNKIKTNNTASYMNDCYNIKVKLLIDGGYIRGDTNNGADINNPLTSESMNEKSICLVFKGTASNRTLIADLLGD